MKTVEKKPKGVSAVRDAMIPQARKDGLVVHVLGEETLVYDLERDRAHCLNRLAVLIWQHCDGKTTVANLMRLLQDELPASGREDLILSALNQLSRAHLLQEKLKNRDQTSRFSRREVMRKLGRAAAISLPLVTSITAPVRAQIGTPPPPPSGQPSGARPLRRSTQNGRSSR